MSKNYGTCEDYFISVSITANTMIPNKIPNQNKLMLFEEHKHSLVFYFKKLNPWHNSSEEPRPT